MKTQSATTASGSPASRASQPVAAAFAGWSTAAPSDGSVATVPEAVSGVGRSSAAVVMVAGRSVAGRRVEKVRQVDGPHPGAASRQPGPHLDQAARVAAHDHVGLRLLHVGHLLLAEPICHLRLRQVVDAGAPAATVAVAHLDEGDAGEPLQNVARL